MFPDHLLLDTVQASKFLWGSEIRSTPEESWEMGGVGISDPSGGLTYQLWHGRLDIDSGAVLLSAPNTPEFVLYSELGITHMDFSFDQNMKPCLVFLKAGVGYFWWYNVVTLQYETINLGAVISPVVLLDDKRQIGADYSDVVVSYVRDGVIFCRDQRDRYTVEYDLGVTGVRKILRAGFTKELRVQFMVLL